MRRIEGTQQRYMGLRKSYLELRMRLAGLRVRAAELRTQLQEQARARALSTRIALSRAGPACKSASFTASGVSTRVYPSSVRSSSRMLPSGPISWPAVTHSGAHAHGAMLF
jgi:hypothetical protein